MPELELRFWLNSRIWVLVHFLFCFLVLVGSSVLIPLSLSFSLVRDQWTGEKVKGRKKKWRRMRKLGSWITKKEKRKKQRKKQREKGREDAIFKSILNLIEYHSLTFLLTHCLSLSLSVFKYQSNRLLTKKKERKREKKRRKKKNPVFRRSSNKSRGFS